MMRKIIPAIVMAGICAIGVLILANHHDGPFPQPLKAVWDMAFYFGVLLSGNVHQPNGVAIAAFFFLLFFGMTLIVLMQFPRRK